MRIDPSLAAAAIATTAPVRPVRSGARFELRAGDGTARRSGVRGAVPTATLAALLALQEDEDHAAGERRRRSVRRGQLLLDGLDELKASLLAGRIGAASLDRLAAALAGASPSGDPALDETVAQIDLRVRVELAKLGRTA